ncbi:MAG: transcription-repair coupling factor [bacterium]
MINNINIIKNSLNILKYKSALAAFALEASLLINGNAGNCGIAVYICKNAYSARNLYKNINFFQNNELKKVFLCEEIIPASILYELQNSKLINGSNNAVNLILTYQSFLSRVPSLLDISETIINVKKGHIIDRNKLIDNLLSFGYEKAEYVQDPFQFSVRGALVDIYGGETDNPVRIDFFDDEVQDIRYFNINSQRSINKIDSYIIFPLKDDIFRKKLNILDIIEKPLIFAEDFNLNNNLNNDNNKENIDGIIKIYDKSYNDNIEEEKKGDKQNFILNSPYDYNSETINIENRLNNLLKKYNNNDVFYFNLNEQASYIQSAKNYYKLYYRDAGFLKCLWDDSKELLNKKKTERFFKLILSKGFSVMLSVKNDIYRERLKEIFSVFNVFEGENYNNGNFHIISSEISAGFFSKKHKFLIFSDQELFKERIEIIDTDKLKKEKNGADFFENIRELNSGDFVVHINHGVGKFTGIKTIASGNLTADYFEIIYAGGDKVYVPSEKIYLIHKYINSGESEPELNKLGTKSWAKSKKKAKEKIEEIAKDLIELYAKRKSERGYSFSKEDEVYREFEENFEYEETEDQAIAIKDVLIDMESNKPMDRLVCGDVGYGKTEVAIRAAFKAAMDGKQVIFIAPTTLLVEQHFTNFTKRFEKYPFKVAYLSRFISAKEEKETIKLLENGSIDIIIGTHKLLSDKIKFKDPGLLIIDEEQKFGAFQKEKIKKIKSSIDVLALSATPIPRTLYLSVSGIRDISILNTAPIGRKNINTAISLYDETMVKEYIYREISRGGQVYFIDNRISHLESILNKFSKIMPDIRVGIAHGRLNADNLEEIMHKFYHKEYDILLSTAIIEAGLDNPNVNTIIINNSEGLGLSQLYQLRGRVGRSYLQAYCLLLVNSSELTKEQDKRLSAIMQYNDLGSGFRLAMADLEIRGAGNILGGAQSGNIDSIGLEMCMQMLKDEIKRIEGKVLPAEIFPEVKVGLNLYIPDGYIKDSKVKLNVYRRLTACSSIEEVYGIKEELIDRFGRCPEEIENLIKVSGLKVFMRKIKVKFIDIQEDKFDIEFYNSSENNSNKEVIHDVKEHEELYSGAYIPEFSNLQISNDLLYDENIKFSKALINFINDKEILSKYIINFLSEYKLRIKIKINNNNNLKNNISTEIMKNIIDIDNIIFILQEIDRYVNI